MKQLFVVTRSRGPEWGNSRAMEDQPDWKEHAVFMNRLVSERFVILGGPLVGTPDVLLIVQAEDENAVRAKFESDPWSRNGLLTVTRTVPWNLRLGSLGQ